MSTETESEKLWGARESVAASEPANAVAVAKLLMLGFVQFDETKPILTPKGEAALVVLESGDGEVPELDNA